MISACLGLMLVARPVVGVSVESSPDATQADALRGWLATRLLEEGYDVAPSHDVADARVSVLARPGGVSVDAWGDGQRSYAVEDGPEAVQRLEILHRALQGVEAVLPAPDHDAARPPGLAIVFEGARDEALVAEVVNAARSEGLVVRAVAEDADALVCVTRRGELAEVGVGPAQDGCAPADTVVTTSDDVGRRDAAETIIARVATDFGGGLVPDVAIIDPETMVGDADLAAIVDDGEASAGVYALTPAGTDVGLATSAALEGTVQPAKAEVRFGADVGFVNRESFDPAVRGRLRVGRIDGMAARVDVGVLPSSSSEHIQVVDTLLLAGADYQLGRNDRVRGSLGVLLGADIHTFRTDLNNGADVNFTAEVPLALSIGLRGGARIDAIAHGGYSNMRFHHESMHLGTWDRSAWRVGLTVGLSHGWRIQ